MNANHSTIPETFEQFAAQQGWGPNSLHHDGARRLWEQEQTAQRTYPGTIPPCPSWCELPAGHAYESYSPDGSGGVIHDRMHRATLGAVHVLSNERSEAGQVEVDYPDITVSSSEEGMTAERAREVASDLLLAADLLDSL